MSPSSPRRIGILGCGGIGWLHANGVRQHPAALRLLAAADANPETLRKFCQDHAVPHGHADYRRVIADPDIDAVIVLLPHFLHEEVCIAALRAGKHVLVEKPIARTVEEADRIIAAAQDAGKVLMVGFNQRYTGWAAQLKAMVEANTSTAAWRPGPRP